MLFRRLPALKLFAEPFASAPAEADSNRARNANRRSQETSFAIMKATSKMIAAVISLGPNDWACADKLLKIFSIKPFPLCW
jgi:hypothetical protein